MHGIERETGKRGKLKEFFDEICVYFFRFLFENYENVVFYPFSTKLLLTLPFLSHQIS